MGYKITASLLTWNRADCLRPCLEAILGEKKRLEEEGHFVEIFLIDNGSTDQSREILQSYEDLKRGVNLHRNPFNYGCAVARNQAMNLAYAYNADFHLFVDGDIQIVPGSVRIFLSYLEAHPEIAAIGPHWDCQTPHLMRASSRCVAVGPLFDILCTPSQYGLFRRELFANPALRFDENYGPGWGLEDEDFGIQVYRAGLRCQMCRGSRYLHHGYHSSVRLLKEAGHDPQALWNERKAYLLKKWEAAKKQDGNIEVLLKVLKNEKLPEV